MEELQYLEVVFQQHPQDLPQSLKLSTKCTFSSHQIFRCRVCSSNEFEKAWIRSHLNTAVLHNTYLLYLASSYLCMIKIVICSSCWGRAACTSQYKQQKKSSRTMTIASGNVMFLIWLYIPIIATVSQASVLWKNCCANIWHKIW